MQKETPYITIGIASYNYAQYLERAFEAIKRQKFKNFEVLYADDGSSDESIQMIRTFIRDNPNMRIRLIQGKNLGVMGNKNRILEHAQGEYIMLCDADDWMENDCLEVLARAAMESNADRIVSEIRNLDSNGKLSHVQSFSRKPTKWTEILHHGALYKRSVIEKNRLRIENRIPDDFCFVERFNLYAKDTCFVRESVYNWVIHADSTSNAGDTKGVWKDKVGLQSVVDLTMELKPSLAREDQLLLDAEMIKMYYGNLVRGAPRVRQQEIKDFYKERNGIIRRANPDYLKNPYFGFFNAPNSPFRRNVYYILCMLNLLERLNLMPLILQLFVFVTKKKPLNI